MGDVSRNPTRAQNVAERSSGQRSARQIAPNSLAQCVACRSWAVQALGYPICSGAFRPLDRSPLLRHFAPTSYGGG